MGKHYNFVTGPEGEQYECNHCGFKTDSKGAMLRHHNPKSSDHCPKREWEKEQEEAETTVSEGQEKLDITGMSPREIVLQHGLPGLEELMKDRLMGYIKSAPGVSKKTHAWILKQWEADETIRRDPNLLYTVLTECGVQDRIAWRITNAINALLNEYAPLLQARGPMFPGRPMIQQRGFWPPSPQGFPQSGAAHGRPEIHPQDA